MSGSGADERILRRGESVRGSTANERSQMKMNHIESYLRENGELTYHNKGVSMLPMLKAGRDLFTLRAKGEARCQKYDVVLYKRGSNYVLHRVVEVRPKDYVILGDNCLNKEYGITDDEILGVLISFVRKGHEISVNEPVYRLYAKVWYALYPLRRVWMRGKAKAAGVWRRLRQGRKTEKPKKPVSSNPDPAEPITKNERDLLYLLGCVIHGIKPDEERVRDMDLPALFEMSLRHSLGAMVYEALKDRTSEEPETAELMKKWQIHRDKALRRMMLMDAERAAIFSEMDQAGIWHAALKGCVLKDMYPAYGLREMSDNDILFDENAREKVREIMTERGYEVKYYNESVHDVYEKPPVYNFEMHVSLMDEIVPEAQKTYFNAIGPRLVPSEGNSMERSMSAEDFYLYLICHAYKHYELSGTGLRSLVDEYYCDTGISLDREKVNTAARSLGVAEFEETLRSLASKLLGEDALREAPTLTEAEAKMFRYIAGSGVYGTVSNLVENRLEKIQSAGPITAWTKVRYVFARIFISREQCRERFPLVYRHPVLLPGLWVWRGIRHIVKDHKKLIKEVRAIKNAK